EAASPLVDHDAEGDVVEPGDGAPVESRPAGVHGDSVELARGACRFCSAVEELPEHPPLVEAAAANHEGVGGIAPGLPQPSAIGFESARGQDERLGGYLMGRAKAMDHG